MLALAGCGLAEDERDEEDKYSYIRFTDKAFEKCCLAACDADGDGRLSRYEARRALSLSCVGRGVGSMYEIGEFVNLRRFDCSGNRLTTLDLRKLTRLEELNCARNDLASLDITGLRSLRLLDCADNELARLNLETNVSLSTLLCGGNDLTTLDVSQCAQIMESLDAQDNPRLEIVYCRSDQRFLQQHLDGHTRLEVRP